MQRVMLFHDGAERGGLERVEQFARFPLPSRLLLLYHRPVPKHAFVFDRGPPASGCARANRGYERLWWPVAFPRSPSTTARERLDMRNTGRNALYHRPSLHSVHVLVCGHGAPPLSSSRSTAIKSWSGNISSYFLKSPAKRRRTRRPARGSTRVSRVADSASARIARAFTAAPYMPLKTSNPGLRRSRSTSRDASTTSRLGCPSQL